ncbi:MAG: 4Fe-4S dicluster domain-containing protein [Caldilinea sp.]|nr:4Fe-4S dicluster domain-containing protein [Caldilineaceae bacterium]MCO5212762.1 4Fe-4S dicluster domain-containing protein [Caldilinea sp.]HRW48549.1 4Fe-4S dicluster domain-containing protein [Caldilinea sp.]
MATNAFLLDISRCIGCQACTAACKTGNELPAGTQFIQLIEQTRGTFPNLEGGFQNHRCYHCTDAACVSVCPTGALFKEDGMTRLNRDVCSGCQYCTDACPFDVPQMVDGRCSKCDACADVVAAGGTPWCVRTCPSDALRFGDRQEILAEAQSRVAAIKERYPKARVYGETEAGGLGVIMVLPDDPEVLDLPANPQVPLLVNTWQKVVQPATMGLTGLSILVTGVAAVIARRNHMQELKLLHKEEAKADESK